MRGLLLQDVQGPATGSYLGSVTPCATQRKPQQPDHAFVLLDHKDPWRDISSHEWQSICQM